MMNLGKQQSGTKWGRWVGLALLVFALTGDLAAQASDSAVQVSRPDVWTANGGPNRTNAFPTETKLNPDALISQNFGKLFSRSVDGQVYAQPLVIQQVGLSNGQVRDLLLVATMHNSIYAFDARDPQASAPIWQVNLGLSFPAGSWPDFLDIFPEVGILSTPVVDRERSLIYVLSYRQTFVGPLFELHALDLASGQERLNGPVRIEGKVASSQDGGQLWFDPYQHLQRPALALVNDRVVIAFGAHADQEPYYGWVFSYNAADLSLHKIFCTTPNDDEAAIWQGGRGPAVDGDSIFLTTGNGAVGDQAYGNSVLRLGAQNLNVESFFSTFDWQDLNDGDLDLGGAGVMLIPGSPLAVVAGKSGWLYLLDRQNLGGISDDDSAIKQKWVGGRYGIFNMAYFGDAQQGLMVTRGFSEPMRVWKFDGNSFSKSAVQVSPVKPYGFDGFAISGSTMDSAILWHTSSVEGGHPGIGKLEAFRLTDITRPIWSSEAKLARDRVGYFSKFANPTISDGMVFVPTFSNEVVAYAQLPEQELPQISAVLHAASGAQSPVSPGLIVTLKGKGLGPEDPVGAQVNEAEDGFVSEVDGTQVTVDGQPATLLYVSDRQTNFVVPFSAATSGSVEIAVVRKGATVASTRVAASACQPGLFTRDGVGSGPVLALRPDGSLVGLGNPAQPGEIVVLSASGLCGAPTQKDGLFSPFTGEQIPVTLTFNGEEVQVLYSGFAPGQVAGVYQINIQIPPDGQRGLGSLLRMKSGQKSAQTNLTIPVN
jgi:uncharacterized protein (TIGR03437 family)